MSNPEIIETNETVACVGSIPGGRLEIFSSSLNTLHRAGDTGRECRLYGLIGDTYLSQGAFDQSIEFYNKSIVIYKTGFIYTQLNTRKQKENFDITNLRENQIILGRRWLKKENP